MENSHQELERVPSSSDDEEVEAEISNNEELRGGEISCLTAFELDSCRSVMLAALTTLIQTWAILILPEDKKPLQFAIALTIIILLFTLFQWLGAAYHSKARIFLILIIVTLSLGFALPNMVTLFHLWSLTLFFGLSVVVSTELSFWRKRYESYYNIAHDDIVKYFLFLYALFCTAIIWALKGMTAMFAGCTASICNGSVCVWQESNMVEGESYKYLSHGDGDPEHCRRLCLFEEGCTGFETYSNGPIESYCVGYFHDACKVTTTPTSTKYTTGHLTREGSTVTQQALSSAWNAVMVFLGLGNEERGEIVLTILLSLPTLYIGFVLWKKSKRLFLMLVVSFALLSSFLYVWTKLSMPPLSEFWVLHYFLLLFSQYPKIIMTFFLNLIFENRIVMPAVLMRRSQGNEFLIQEVMKVSLVLVAFAFYEIFTYTLDKKWQPVFLLVCVLFGKIRLVVTSRDIHEDDEREIELGNLEDEEDNV
eukprot:g1986.t1